MVACSVLMLMLHSMRPDFEPSSGTLYYRPAVIVKPLHYNVVFSAVACVSCGGGGRYGGGGGELRGSRSSYM